MICLKIKIECIHTPSLFFFFNDTATTEIYTLSLHDALPIWSGIGRPTGASPRAVPGQQRQLRRPGESRVWRSEEHTSELQSPCNLVCRLLLEKKKITRWLPQHPMQRLTPNSVAQCVQTACQA